MSRWFRLDDDVINDPKILMLPEAMRWTWIAFLCIASKNEGILPKIEIVALSLRVKATKAAEYLTRLVSAGLIDNTETGFVPHNWNKRQFKSDVSTDRVKRFRKQERNVSETPPQTQAQTQPQTESSEPIGSGAIAPVDARSDLFGRGLQTLARLTGKGPDACRSFVGKCLKAAGDDAVTVLGLIEDADRNRVVDPSAWIVARLKSTGPPGARPLTEFQRGRNETRKILDDLGNFAAAGSTGGPTNFEFLSGDSGQQPAGIRGGAGANPDDLLAICHQEGS